MVGTLEQKKETFALVKAPDNTLYRVKNGNYIGQNFGRIVGISESAVKLKEIVQDSARRLGRERTGPPIVGGTGGKEMTDNSATRAARWPRSLAFALARRSAASRRADANSIQSINVSAQSGGKHRGARHDEGAAGESAGRVSPSTTRRASRSTSRTPPTRSGRNAQDVAEGDLRSINVVQAGDRTRMVLELGRAVRYDTQVDGRTVLDHARRLGGDRRRRRDARRRSRSTSPKQRPGDGATRCATSTSAAAAAAKAASSSTFPTARSASTCARRAAASSSTSPTPTCRATSSAAWT